MAGQRKRALLVVDTTVEQTANVSERAKQVVAAIRQLAILDIWTLKIDTRLWLHSGTESTLSRVYPKWGITMGVPDSEGAALVPELRDCGLEFVAKKHYSSFVASDVLARLQSAQIQDVYVVGINTDFCIFDTALDAQARGCFFTYVVEEGVSSLNGRAGHREGIRWIKAHLGNEAVVSLQDVLSLSQQP